MTWHSSLFLAKAKCYIERGLAEDPDTPTRAWWFHFALEPLIRAAVAHRHPALLADPRSTNAILVSLGEDPLDAKRPSSRSLSQILHEILPQCVPSIDTSVASAALSIIARRNEECHGPSAAFEDLKDDAWMGDFLRVAHVLLTHLGVPLEDILGEGLAAHARDILAEDEATAKKLVARLIAQAQEDFSGPKTVSYAGIVSIVHQSGAVTEITECPACRQHGLLLGRPLHVGPQRLVDDQLTRAVTVGASKFTCEHCGLALTGSAQIAAAGLNLTFLSTEILDPWETLSLDVADEAERMGMVLVDPADEYGYQDE